jgi:hypothetical protein
MDECQVNMTIKAWGRQNFKNMWKDIYYQGPLQLLMPVLVHNELDHKLRSGHNITNDQRISTDDSAFEMSIRLFLDQYPTKNSFSDGKRELVEN